MATEISVPRLGWSMDEGTFVDWLKQDGDFVRKGDMLFVLEGDKAAQEIESFDEGYLRLIPSGPKCGDTVKVGQVLAYLLAKDEPLPADRGLSSPMTAVAAARPAREVEKAPTGHSAGDRKASPRARRAAERIGIDWQFIRGTGRHGRVRERDVIAAAGQLSRSSTPPASARQPHLDEESLAGQHLPLTPVRRTIAARMIAATQQAAPVTLSTKTDATHLVTRREQWRVVESSSGDAVPSYTDMILKLTAAALKEHPLLQAQWRENGLFVPAEINIGIAVDTDAGLFVPVVHDVPSLSLQQLAVETRKLIELARTRRLSPQHMHRGTFTISSLGSFGIDAFTPIIQLPQCAVLGIGRIAPEPAVVGGQIVVRPMVWLSLTFDHRIVDGAPAARFLATVKRNIENAEALVGLK